MPLLHHEPALLLAALDASSEAVVLCRGADDTVLLRSQSVRLSSGAGCAALLRSGPAPERATDPKGAPMYLELKYCSM